MITITPSSVRADATATVLYQGAPNRTVTFSITAGDGTLTPINSYTDASGRAAARYTPGTVGATALIQVQVGV